MNKQKIEEIKKEVERQLSRFSDLKEFTIGKAKDCQDRFEAHYRPRGYQSYIELAYGSPQAISEGESLLIAYFQNHPKWGSKCANEKGGSAGNENATYLYVTTKCKMRAIEDLYDELMQDEWKPINLDEL